MKKKVATESGGAPKRKTSRSAKAMDPVSPPASAGSETHSPSPATGANVTDMAGPSQARNLIVQQNNESGLLKLPNEIKQRIWILAVAVDEPITPFQLRSRSNKFVWSTSQIDKRTDKKNVSGVPQLTAVQLAKVCRQVYQEVAATQLFYKVNNFLFTKVSDYAIEQCPSTYLIAITEPRRKAIRSISFTWQHWSKAEGAQIFNLITACQGLQSLELTMLWSLGSHYDSSPSPPPGLKDCLIAVQGLKKLTFKAGEITQGYTWGGTQHAKTKALCEHLRPLLEEQVKKPRPISYNMEKFRRAQITANLDVHGEGRLSEDKRPGMISSRTRQQARNVENLANDGTLPKRQMPKYDLNGDLAWTVHKVEALREVRSDDGMQSVEFKVKSGPSTSRYRWDDTEVPKEISWEDVSVLNSGFARHEIIEFYEKNPKSFGKQLVLDTWTLRDGDDGRDEKNKARHEKRLKALIRHDAVLERWEAEKAAREERQAVKAGKANNKVKKVTPAKIHS